MQRVFSMMAVVTGSGTAAGTAMHLIPIVTSVVGATCAVITTFVAIYYSRKNYNLNLIKAGLKPPKDKKD
jgi:hypothetical protein